MTDEKTQTQEFKLDPDCELRFEVETKNEKVALEVCIISFVYFVLYYIVYFHRVFNFISIFCKDIITLY